MINNQGEATTTFREIESTILGFYDTLYTKSLGSRFTPLNFDWPNVTDFQNSLLTSHFTIEEIKAALKSLGKGKAPGPDGFTIEFFQMYWDLVKVDFQRLFEQFFENGRLNACTQENFICLIQKKEDVVQVNDFRPISLTTSVYKIIAKVLVERLKKVMPSIIAPTQSAFIEGRQILDPILIANAVVEEY